MLTTEKPTNKETLAQDIGKGSGIKLTVAEQL